MVQDVLPAGAQEIIAVLERRVAGGKKLADLLIEPDDLPKVNWALSALSTFSPSRYDALVGSAPQTNAKILIDECVGASLVPAVHRILGRGLLSDCIFGKGASDNEIFYGARDHGIDAIVTRDKSKRRSTDLGKIARKAFQNYAVNSNRNLPPGIIVVCEGTERAAAVLTENAARIQAYLANRAFYLQQNVFHILDLTMPVHAAA